MLTRAARKAVTNGWGYHYAYFSSAPPVPPRKRVWISWLLSMSPPRRRFSAATMRRNLLENGPADYRVVCRRPDSFPKGDGDVDES